MTTPDLPCPKCGGHDVRMMYEPAEEYASASKWSHGMCVEAHGRRSLPEHFHRTCQRCHYSWPTFDVMKRGAS